MEKALSIKVKVDFMEAKYKDVQKVKTYNFTKFGGSLLDPESAARKALNKKKKLIMQLLLQAMIIMM